MVAGIDSSTDSHLLLADPPHDPAADRALLEEMLGLSRAEATMSGRQPWPTVWDHGSADDVGAVVDRLTSGGFRVVGCPTHALIPEPDVRTIRRFQFSPTSLRLECHDGTSTDLSGDIPVIAVRCHPPDFGTVDRRSFRQAATAARRDKSVRQEARQKLATTPVESPDGAFVDLWRCTEGPCGPYRFAAGMTSFDGLGPAMQTSVRANLVAVQGQLVERFPLAVLDDRLVHAPPDQPLLVRGRSLITLLGHPRGAHQVAFYDLLSRIAYLTNRARITR